MKHRIALVALPVLLSVALVSTGVAMIIVNNTTTGTKKGEVDVTVDSAINNSSLTFTRNEDYGELSIIPQGAIGVKDTTATSSEPTMKADLIGGIKELEKSDPFGENNLKNFKSSSIGFDYDYKLTSFISTNDVTFASLTDAQATDEYQKVPRIDNNYFYPTDIELTLTMTVPVKNAVNIYIVNKDNIDDSNNTHIRRICGDSTKAPTETASIDTASLSWNIDNDKSFTFKMSLDDGLNNDLTSDASNPKHLALDDTKFSNATMSKSAKMKSYVTDMYNQSKLFKETDTTEHQTEIKGFLGGFMFMPNKAFKSNTEFTTAVDNGGPEVEDYNIQIKIDRIDLKVKYVNKTDAVPTLDEINQDGKFKLYPGTSILEAGHGESLFETA